MNIKQLPRSFIIHIVLPVMLVGGLFVLSIFQILIPRMESQLMERKKETIRELSRVALSILEEYHQEELNGNMTREEAQAEAALRIGSLRYGDEGKDYYWITDTHPTMIIHPYRPDLNGEDLSDFTDQAGKKLFVAFVEAVQESGSGYVDYYWQWKDNPEQIVPKLSYVILFEPWQWVLGTGIYINDVKEDISQIKRNLSYISFAITGIMLLILFYIARQSLEIEQKRSKAEASLKESNERYRALVESSTEGTMMVLEGKCAYSNPTLQEWLGLTAEELHEKQITELFSNSTLADQRAREWLTLLIAEEEVPPRFEARLLRKDEKMLEVLLSVTRIQFAEKNGFILNIRDLTQHKEMETALDSTRRQFITMTDAMGLAVFRSTWGKKSMVLEANPAFRKIFGIGEDDNIQGLDWMERVVPEEERAKFVTSLNATGIVQNFTFHIARQDQTLPEVSVFAMLTRDENGNARFCDAILEDVTEQRKAEQDREKLIAQLQASQVFLSEPIHRVLSEAITCDMEESILEAAVLMSRKKSSSLLVTGPSGQPLGIVTDHDMRQRVIAGNLDPHRPVYEIISAPLITISDHALVYEAIVRMQEHFVSRLVVKGDDGAPKGIVHLNNLFQVRQYSAAILTQSIRHAQDVSDLQQNHEQLPYLIRTLLDSGTHVRHINRIITSISDEITTRVLEIALKQVGPPPCAFTFLTMGSEGREEQTLVTDQDNGILFEDMGEMQNAREYFLKLGTMTCDNLNAIGYAFCQGGIMAKNPRWTLSLSEWEENFHHSIYNANPQELLELNMMFDFRSVYGASELAHQLRAWVFDEMANYPPFFLHFAQDAINYRLPLGIFGNILMESSAEGFKTLNLKDAMIPVVNYARLYALKHRIQETHTMDRLETLHKMGLLSRDTYEDIKPTYEALMRMRLDRQVSAILANRKPDNLISPQEWTPLESAMLKRYFSNLSGLRKKISYDFLGMA